MLLFMQRFRFSSTEHLFWRLRTTEVPIGVVMGKVVEPLEVASHRYGHGCRVLLLSSLPIELTTTRHL